MCLSCLYVCVCICMYAFVLYACMHKHFVYGDGSYMHDTYIHIYIHTYIHTVTGRWTFGEHHLHKTYIHTYIHTVNGRWTLGDYPLASHSHGRRKDSESRSSSFVVKSAFESKRPKIAGFSGVELRHCAGEGRKINCECMYTCICMCMYVCECVCMDMWRGIKALCGRGQKNKL